MNIKDFVKQIHKKDSKLFKNDIKNNEKDTFKESENDINLIADFTEYSPLHNGHFHCMKTAKSLYPNSLFVAIVPGLFERSGRGLPYILPREKRAEIAVSVGADIVVEGPPMGIMGSGQYSLNTDIIPRGFNPTNGFNKILDAIQLGHGVSPKPYKIVDMNTHKILLKDKLAEDNYIITSLSKSLTKINFNFKNKFLFVKRIKGVSGSDIRKAISENNFDNVEDMMPIQTINILKREILANRAPLHNLRYDENIINNSNQLDYEELKNLNLFSDRLAKKFINNRPFNNVEEVYNNILQGFSKFYKNRILSVLETAVPKKIISSYIDYYPSIIRILDYKNKDVLKIFMEKINNINVASSFPLND